MTTQSTEELIVFCREVHQSGGFGGEHSRSLALDMIDRLAQLSTPVVVDLQEIDKLRAIISQCAAALGNGAYVSADASLEFMAELPGEIAACVSRLSTPVGGDVREKIAVIIATSYMNPLEALADENEFGFHESSHDIRHKYHGEHAWKRALVKADAILTLSIPASGEKK